MASKKRKIGMISFHGGCFTGGSADWDKKPNEVIANNNNLTIHAAEFPKSSFTDFEKWMKSDDTKEWLTHNRVKYVIGRSSGGYLARKFFKYHRSSLEKAIFICPVLQPIKRAKQLEKFRSRTETFFGKDHDNALVDDTEDISKDELVLAATHDANIPKNCYTPGQQESLVYPGPRTHVGMCKSTSPKTLTNISEFLG